MGFVSSVVEKVGAKLTELELKLGGSLGAKPVSLLVAFDRTTCVFWRCQARITRVGSGLRVGIEPHMSVLSSSVSSGL